MSAETASIIGALIVLVSLLYSSVGHAGGSGYLMVFAFMGMAPEVMRPTALVLNVLVAAVASWRFWQAGHFNWSLLWPFAAASIPAAYVGGTLMLPGRAYKVVVGLILVYSAAQMFFTSRGVAEKASSRPPPWASLAIGAALGLLAGLVGVGGGIFLSPVLLLAGWAAVRETAATSAVFILVNSIAGLLGQLGSLDLVPTILPAWAGGVVIAGWIGSTYGSRRLPTRALRPALALVLVVAGVKLMLV